MQNDILEQLITLSTNLGKPTNDYVILGEGNTLAKAVKAARSTTVE
jgi:hypothetical protein